MRHAPLFGRPGPANGWPVRPSIPDRLRAPREGPAGPIVADGRGWRDRLLRGLSHPTPALIPPKGESPLRTSRAGGVLTVGASRSVCAIYFGVCRRHWFCLEGPTLISW